MSSTTAASTTRRAWKLQEFVAHGAQVWSLFISVSDSDPYFVFRSVSSNLPFGKLTFEMFKNVLGR
jgi:hypothetical protein